MESRCIQKMGCWWFDTNVHTICRCADVPWVFRSIRDFCHMLVIIPGPDEPKCLDPYVEELFQDFKKYGPSGEPCLMQSADENRLECSICN